MPLDRVVLKNVRAIGNADITVGDVTVLVGPNGIGKTTVLNRIAQALANGTMPEGESKLFVGNVELTSRHGNSAMLPQTSFTELPGTAYLQVAPYVLRLPSAIASGTPLLRPQGEGLAGAVSRAILEWPERHEAIQRDLRTIIPDFRGLRSAPNNGSFHLRFDFAQVKDVGQQEVSTGTLAALAILLLAHCERPAERQGFIALLDDPETGLHPGAQEELARRLLDLAQATGIQIVMATHSPYIVDAVDPARVWVFGRRPDGLSEARRLTDHPDAARSLHILSAGEFWGSSGEAWVIGTP